ncbi:hypothetical protein DSO57_1038169 [Entomophthora muscae]|uniref:Uncharacterized protein n=2 Tax=Entomophthora muscae TaxID=34485 RepID=A0ACC2TL50_9FUNG|nr:hypothetical protein DSO57_1038169 [Entomophthora muscae]
MDEPFPSIEALILKNLNLLESVPVPISPPDSAPELPFTPPLSSTFRIWSPQFYPDLNLHFPPQSSISFDGFNRYSHVPSSTFADLQERLDTREISYIKFLAIDVTSSSNPAASPPLESNRSGSSGQSIPDSEPPNPETPDSALGSPQSELGLSETSSQGFVATGHPRPATLAPSIESSHSESNPSESSSQDDSDTEHSGSDASEHESGSEYQSDCSESSALVTVQSVPATYQDLPQDIVHVMYACNLERNDPTFTDEMPRTRLGSKELDALASLKRKRTDLCFEDALCLNYIEILLREEQTEFSGWLKARAKKRLKFVSEQALTVIKEAIAKESELICQRYPRHYIFTRSIPLTERFPAKDVRLEGKGATLGTPLDFGFIESHVGYSLPPCHVSKENLPRLVDDRLVNKFVCENQVDVVISASSLTALVASSFPCSKRFILPIEVVDLPSGGRTVYVGKPLPNVVMTARSINEKFYNNVIRRNLFCRSSNTSTFAVPADNSLNTSVPSQANVPQESCYQSNAASYAAWMFGSVKVLIRSKVHGLICRDGKNEVTSLKTKMEYSPDFGAELVTPEEKARAWIHSLIRDSSDYLVARVDPLANRLLSYTTSKPVMDMDDPEFTARCGNLLCHLFEALKQLPPNVYMLHRETGALSLDLFKAARTQDARPGPKLSANFQRRIDIHTELEAPLSVDSSEETLEASYINIEWGKSAASCYLLNRPPFTFPEQL